MSPPHPRQPLSDRTSKPAAEGGLEGIHTTVELPTEASTQDWARALAPQLKGGDVLFLEGPLGAGKTALVRFLARSLGLDEDEPVPSPSYTLLQEIPSDLPILHGDFYRLAGEADVDTLGVDDWNGFPGVLVVEWPGPLIARRTPDLVLTLEITGETSRRLCATAQSVRGQEILRHVNLARSGNT